MAAKMRPINQATARRILRVMRKSAGRVGVDGEKRAMKGARTAIQRMRKAARARGQKTAMGVREAKPLGTPSAPQ